MTKIYTRTGDQGTTSLFSGKRIDKDDTFLHALGTIDECNSAIGVALSHLTFHQELKKYREQLTAIQHALFDLGAAVATPRSAASPEKIEKTRFGHEATKQLELWMDEIEALIPPLKTFILPGGHPSAAHLHQARSFCRRAERHTLPLHKHGAISDHVIAYLNRLSDYLFMVARAVNHITKTPETLWEHHLTTE